MMSFEEPRAKYPIDKKHFFKYLQLRHYIKTNQNNLLSKPCCTELEKIITKKCLRKGAISELYNLLTSFSNENSACKLKAWKENIHTNISEEDWKAACVNVHSASINARLRIIQYKWLMRMYVTPAELNRYDPNIPDVCITCTEHRGTLFHCIWQCRTIIQ